MLWNFPPARSAPTGCARIIWTKNILFASCSPSPEAAGCKTPRPGAWETAAFCRLKNCTLPQLHQALYQKKELLQAWSIRGVPLIFPTADSDVFLSALIAQEGEEPWIYTKGIGLALDYLGMSFAELLPLVESAAEYLEDHTIKSKEELDRVLAPAGRRTAPCSKTVSLERPFYVRRARPADSWRRSRLLSAAALLL